MRCLCRNAARQKEDALSGAPKAQTEELVQGERIQMFVPMLSLVLGQRFSCSEGMELHWDSPVQEGPDLKGNQYPGQRGLLVLHWRV